jgi:hypothetical protein
VGWNEAAYDTSAPTISEFAAGGSIAVTGPCALTIIDPGAPPISEFAAAGYVEVFGPCQVDFVGVDIPASAEFAGCGYIAVESTCQLEVLAPAVSAFAAAGSIKICGAGQVESLVRDDLVSAFAAAGSIEVSGTGVLNSPALPVTALVANTGLGAPVILVSSNCAMGVLYPPVAEFRAAGCILIVNPETILGELYDTWSLTGHNYEPSYFTGFNFNSYATHRGKSYGAGPDGIYLLEGPDDNGQPIHTGVRLGPHNFGTDKYKRLRALRLGKCGDDVQARVQAGEDEGYFEVDRGRVQVSRNLQGREMTLDIVDFERLSQVEIAALILARR